jgi:hypothetical protein
MATDTDKKLYVALGVLAVLGGTLFLVKKKEKEEAATYTLSGQAAALPKITITEDDTKAIDKIVLTKGGEDGGAGTEVELQKKGEEWRVTRPVDALANQANVKSLLDNLKTLKITEQIETGKASYDKYKLADGKGLKVVVNKGNAVVLDAVFGENGGRGQMTRIAGKDAVFATKGYSNYLYEREVKGWRDTTVFKFEENVVSGVTITNEHGDFVFAKEGDKWTAKHKGAALAGFEESKLKDLIRAYRSLNADGFAAKEKTEADLGLDKPVATLVMTLSDGAKREVRVGATAEGSSRWAKATGASDLISISSWAADWALGEPKKFQKPEDKKDGGAAKPAGPAMGAMPGMPPGMAMPPGHGMDDGHGH